jgi:hypothetical protein
MKLADLRMGWRMLLREPGFSIVTVLGLAGAFAAAFLLLGYVRYCFGYDSHVPDAARVALVKQRINWFPRPDWDVRALLPLAGVARASGMVEHAAGVAPVRQPLRVGTALTEVGLWTVDPAFAQVFGIVPVAGDLMAALSRPEGLAVTRDAARRLFGTDTNILHRTVRVDGEPLQVLAVLPDVPPNSTTRWEALAGPLSRARPAAERTVTPDWRRGAVYLKLRPVPMPLRWKSCCSRLSTSRRSSSASGRERSAGRCRDQAPRSSCWRCRTPTSMRTSPPAAPGAGTANCPSCWAWPPSRC